jgi:hypothetical protein
MSRVSFAAAGALTLTTMLLVIGCGPDATAPLDPGSISLLLVSGNGQSGVAGTELPQPLIVRVVDPKTGAGVGGVTVNFRVTSGGGRMFAGVTVTDAKPVPGDP